MKIPHEDIRMRADRSWSMRLFDELISTNDEEEVDRICDTIEVLDDYRLEPVLLSVLQDRSRADFARNSASKGLCSLSTTDSEEERRMWWHSDDPILKRHSVRMFERTEDELLLSILKDSEHPLYFEAACRVCNGVYDEMQFQYIKVDLLSHQDIEIRNLAARAVIYAEPIAAEAGLIKCLTQSDSNLFNTALTTVSYYGSQNVLRALADLRSSCSEDRTDDLEGVFYGVADNFATAYWDAKEAVGGAELAFKKWLQPVWNLLNDEIAAYRSPRCRPSDLTNEITRPTFESATEIVENFAEVESFDKDMWFRFNYTDWSKFSDDSKELLSHFFYNHQDHCVRALACYPLSQWQKHAVLNKLLDDPYLDVRRAAAYRARNLAKDPIMADRLWQILNQPNTESSHASEVFDSWAHHEIKSVLYERLLEIASSAVREGMRYSAVSKLNCAGKTDALCQLVPLLESEPAPSWDFHTALVRACSEHQIKGISLKLIDSADDFDLQRELAIYKTKLGD